MRLSHKCQERESYAVIVNGVQPRTAEGAALLLRATSRIDLPRTSRAPQSAAASSLLHCSFIFGKAPAA